MKNILKIVLYTLLVLPFFSPLGKVFAQENEFKIGTYVGGIGCPHCTVVSPVLHDRVNEGGFVLIEYEIYSNVSNSIILTDFAENYGTELGIPLLVFGQGNSAAGDTPIIGGWNEMYSNTSAGVVNLPDGSSQEWEDLDLSSLKRYPSIHSAHRVAIRKSITSLSDEQNGMIKDFISSPDIENAVLGLEGKSVKPTKFIYPGGTINFENAVDINGWLLQWDGPAVEGTTSDVSSVSNVESSSSLSIGKTVGLALADSVNPCALSVLALVLLSIVTYNPGSKKQILFSGLAFVLAVVVMYVFYGFLIVKAFQAIQSIAEIRLYLYKGLAVGAIILGLLEIKDYLKYKPGSVGTEMPLSLRPKVQNLIAKITSPAGAFGMGLFVTLFLLPCTIGPYVILGGMLADSGFVSAMPYLLLYNLIFVLPMIAVVLIVFFGAKRVEDVSDWKEKNIKKLHLVAGIALVTIGVLMLFGII